MILRPSSDYRFAFKKGMRGTDVAALQINLAGVTVDGVFGHQTHRAVLAVQNKGNLTMDGIAGLMTQQYIIRAKSTSVGGDLPSGLLRSLAASESGFALAAFSRHPSDAGYDLGAFQHSSGADPDPSQSFIRDSYDVRKMAAESAARFRKAFATYRDEPHVTTDRRAWELAILSHNWPVAAENLAEIGRIYKTKPDDVPEAWIEQASGGRLHTAREWVAAYIERATIYVDWEK
jgi:hypothetical protein